MAQKHDWDLALEDAIKSISKSRAFRLLVRLGQPFSAFLLAQQRSGEPPTLSTANAPHLNTNAPARNARLIWEDKLVHALTQCAEVAEKEKEKSRNILRSWKKKAGEVKRMCRTLEEEVDTFRQRTRTCSSPLRLVLSVVYGQFDFGKTLRAQLVSKPVGQTLQRASCSPVQSASKLQNACSSHISWTSIGLAWQKCSSKPSKTQQLTPEWNCTRNLNMQNQIVGVDDCNN
ncbi:hypothetical protein EDD22DRAFT_951424 [Suillus occidentalis]|nr:hypothetical protein EDD22DRAFT_951424 [Suillus occidentalis]